MFINRKHFGALLGALVAAMGIFPSFVLAGGVNNVTVIETTIYMGSTRTGALVKFSPASPGLEGCSYAGGNYVFIDYAAQVTPNGRDLYATVLAAYLAGRTIGIGTSGCTAEGFPIVYGINVFL